MDNLDDVGRTRGFYSPPVIDKISRLSERVWELEDAHRGLGLMLWRREKQLDQYKQENKMLREALEALNRPHTHDALVDWQRA